MRYPADQKEKTRRHIVDVVARALRRDGIASSSVVPLMREAGLTQGAFYSHFASRDELLIDVVELAVRQTRSFAESWVGLARREGKDATARFIEEYLSMRHLTHREATCIFASLGSELWRQAPAVRSAASDACTGIVGLLADTMAPSRRAMARPLYMMMAGVLSCARLTDDQEEQAAILDEGRRAAFILAGCGP